MPIFVHHDSIVRSIWGDADTILFAFAGSAAEFALNRAVDWLFYTGGLPADPLGRLFSTARFARDIAFAGEAAARRSIGRIPGAPPQHRRHPGRPPGRRAGPRAADPRLGVPRRALHDHRLLGAGLRAAPSA